MNIEPWDEEKNGPLMVTHNSAPDSLLLKAAIAAYNALRSYQYGNSSPDLAEEVADSLETALRMRTG